jgi:Fe-S oxidoreductase
MKPLRHERQGVNWIRYVGHDACSRKHKVWVERLPWKLAEKYRMEPYEWGRGMHE